MDAPLQKPEKSTDTGRTARIKEEVNQEYTKDKDMLKMHILFSLLYRKFRFLDKGGKSPADRTYVKSTGEWA